MLKKDKRKILNRIKVVLVEKNLTNNWLAEELGKSPTTVSRWCTNDVQPTLTTLNVIADLLGVDIHELIVSSKTKQING